MNLQQLHGQVSRLKDELAAAYFTVPWNSGHIDRLSADLAAIEREIAATLAVDHDDEGKMRHAA